MDKAKAFVGGQVDHVHTIFWPPLVYHVLMMEYECYHSSYGLLQLVPLSDAWTDACMVLNASRPWSFDYGVVGWYLDLPFEWVLGLWGRLISREVLLF